MGSSIIMDETNSRRLSPSSSGDGDSNRLRWWVLHRYRAYARGCVLSALFLLPLTVHLGIADVYQLPKLSMLWFLGVLAAGLLIAWSAERRVWFPRPRLAYVTVAFLGACALSTALSRAPVISLLGTEERHGGLLPILLYVALAVVILGVYWERPSDIVEVAKASVLGSAGLGLYILIGAAGLDPVPWLDPLTGGDPEFPSGTLGNSNFAGGYLSIVLPLAVYLMCTAVGRWRQSLWGAVVAVDALALWYAHTRAGLLAAVAGMASLALLHYGWTRRTKVVATTAAVLLTAVALAVLAQRDSGGADPVTDSSRLRTSTLQTRLYYWAAAGRIFLDHPVVGTGLDTFYASYPPHRLAGDGAKFGRSTVDKPHNIFFEYAANAGVLGIGSYMVLLGLTFRYAFRRRRSLEGDARLLLGSFVAALVAYAVQGFFSMDVPPLAVMGWVVLGCIAVIADPALVAAREARATESTEPKPINPVPPAPAGQRMRWPVHVAVGTAVLALVVLGSRPLRSAAAAAEGRFDEARSIHPLNPAYADLEADQTVRRAVATRDPVDKRRLYEEALSDYRAALRVKPNDPTYLIKIASVNTSWAESLDFGRFGEAQRSWKQALDHDPTNHHLRGIHQRAISNVRAAVTRREADALARPDDVSGWIAVARAHVAVEQPDRARAAVERALTLDPSNREARALAAAIPS